MSRETHGYLPVLYEGRVGFSRKALAEMSQPELDYIAETREINTLTDLGAMRDEKWKVAYEKLKAATG